MTAPQERFTLKHIVTAGEIACIRKFEATIKELAESAESENPVKLRAEIQRLAAINSKQPTEESVADYALLTERVGEWPQRNPALAQRYRTLRRASRGMAWKFYDENLKPLMVEIFRRAEVAVLSEIEAQKQREQQWLKDSAELEAWLAHYGAKSTVPTALDALGRLHHAVRKGLAYFGVGTDPDYKPLPKPDPRRGFQPIAMREPQWSNEPPPSVFGRLSALGVA